MKLRILAFGLIAAGCAGSVDGNEDSADPEMHSTSQALSNGLRVADVETSHVALEVWTDTYNDYVTFCSGELITPWIVKTAAHCVQAAASLGRTIYVNRSDLRDRVPVSTTMVNPVFDVADLGLQAGIQFIPTSGTRTPIYGGSNASLVDTEVTCFGRGGFGIIRSPLTIGNFRVTFNDNLNPPDLIHIWPTGAPNIINGDSGGGCFLNGELVGIVSETYGGFSTAVSPESFLASPIVFSSAGPAAGYPYCIAITEPSDPDSWTDNYLCSRTDIFRWSYAGPIDGMNCTQIHEAADPHTWDDNYLCTYSSDARFEWSSAGPIYMKQCIQWLEASDPDTWNDNYLCWS